MGRTEALKFKVYSSLGKKGTTSGCFVKRSPSLEAAAGFCPFLSAVFDLGEFLEGSFWNPLFSTVCRVGKLSLDSVYLGGENAGDIEFLERDYNVSPVPLVFCQDFHIVEKLG